MTTNKEPDFIFIWDQEVTINCWFTDVISDNYAQFFYTTDDVTFTEHSFMMLKDNELYFKHDDVDPWKQWKEIKMGPDTQTNNERFVEELRLKIKEIENILIG